MNTATYSCDTAYILEGDSTRTCEVTEQNTGTWSPAAPTCRARGI